MCACTHLPICGIDDLIFAQKLLAMHRCSVNDIHRNCMSLARAMVCPDIVVVGRHDSIHDVEGRPASSSVIEDNLCACIPMARSPVQSLTSTTAISSEWTALTHTEVHAHVTTIETWIFDVWVNRNHMGVRSELYRMASTSRPLYVV